MAPNSAELKYPLPPPKLGHLMQKGPRHVAFAFTSNMMEDPVARQPTYHNKDAAYLLPNDATEQQRLNHQALGLAELMDNEIVHAPIADPRFIVDVGCGTGIVTRFLGNSYPNAHVYGVDLTPVPPPQDFSYLAEPDSSSYRLAKLSGTEAENVRFIEGNFDALVDKQDPSLSPGTFDYLFSRLLMGGVTDWPGHLKRALQLLKPGGWVERHEIAIWITKDNEVISKDWQWANVLIDAAAKIGIDMLAGTNLQKYMRDAGFVDVRMKKYDFPMTLEEASKSQRRITEAYNRDICNMFWFMMQRILEPQGYGQEEIDEYRAAMKKDFGPGKGKFFSMWAVWGRKPE